MDRKQVEIELRMVYNTDISVHSRLGAALLLIAHYRAKEFRLKEALQKVQDELSCINTLE
jgi:hypothetical protein